MKVVSEKAENEKVIGVKVGSAKANSVEVGSVKANSEKAEENRQGAVEGIVSVGEMKSETRKQDRDSLALKDERDGNQAWEPLSEEVNEL